MTLRQPSPKLEQPTTPKSKQCAVQEKKGKQCVSNKIRVQTRADTITDTGPQGRRRLTSRDYGMGTKEAEQWGRTCIGGRRGRRRGGGA
jgi:hypothetical protein